MMNRPPEIIARLDAAARASVESDLVKKRFHDPSTVAPDANEHAPDVLQQLVTRDVAKYTDRCRKSSSPAPCCRIASSRERTVPVRASRLAPPFQRTLRWL
jgi:hypothetical protein